MQEPIAAAISYGFMNAKNENWLIYDLGGGTFDVALICAKDGVLSVLSHNGDNFLGGKDFDWLIVDKIIAPKILEKYSISDFNRGNDKYRSIFSKLKYISESAKIYLSQYEKTTIEIDGIGHDEKNDEIYLSIEFTKKDFEKLIKPQVDRTIELSKETLKEASMKNSSVGKIILVGGPTQIPYIKERLAQDLKITVDSSVDPLTVVAKGACVFGIGQKIPKELLANNTKNIAKGGMSLHLNYESLTSETEETISGVIEELKDSEEEYYIQIQADSGLYSGSKLRLKNGKFFDTVTLEANKTNFFWVYLFDKKGNSVRIDQDSFTITHGLSISGAPIPHSIGIAVSRRDIKMGFSAVEVVEKFFEKGSILPLKRTDIFKTARRLVKDESNNPLWIRIGEGESEIPDRNVFICELGIRGGDLPYDLPEGSDIEITVQVDESREISVTAYIPLVDLTLNARSTFKDEIIDVSDLESEFDSQIERSKILQENCTTEEKNNINSTVQSVTSSLKNARLDEDEKRKANKQIKDLKVVLDKLEKQKEMPQLVKEFNLNVIKTKETISEYAQEKYRESYNDELNKMKEEGDKAIGENDKTLLINVSEQINDLRTKVIMANPSTWAYHFEQITQGDKKFTNEKEAQYFIDKGKRAMESGDADELKRCVRSLSSLLPSEEQEIVKKSNSSGITR
ncbi:MAG: Hsp70 family protein [Bacteroidales bacterium]